MVLLTVFSSIYVYLSGCNQQDVPSSVISNQPVESLEQRLLGADVERGELLSFACRACHTLGLGEDHMIGPNLYGIFQRDVASSIGFEYSGILLGEDFIWEPEILDQWLADPDDFLAGNNMLFAGFSAAEDRADVIKYLMEITLDESL